MHNNFLYPSQANRAMEWIDPSAVEQGRISLESGIATAKILQRR
jgi:hypothetical protein